MCALLIVARHDGTEVAYGRAGDRVALLLPADMTFAEAVARLGPALNYDDLFALLGELAAAA
jgi:hypothetical protein